MVTMRMPHDPPREGLLLPGFEAPRIGGGSVRVRSYRGRRALFLVFIHGLGCAQCEAYVSDVGDAYPEFVESGAEVILISPDRLDSEAVTFRRLTAPFPVAHDPEGSVFARFDLRPKNDAACMVTDRFGEPRIWQIAGTGHSLPDLDGVRAEFRYLGLTCSGGGPVPLWRDEPVAICHRPT
jgi:peroxiredoxin